MILLRSQVPGGTPPPATALASGPHGCPTYSAKLSRFVQSGPQLGPAGGSHLLLHAVRQDSQQQQQHQQTTADNLMPRGNYNCRRLQTKCDGMLRKSHCKPRDPARRGPYVRTCSSCIRLQPSSLDTLPVAVAGLRRTLKSDARCPESTKVRAGPLPPKRAGKQRLWPMSLSVAAKLPSSLRAFMRRALDALGNRYFPPHTPSPPAVTRPCASKNCGMRH